MCTQKNISGVVSSEDYQYILNIRPVRNPVYWKKENGLVVIIYKKHFTRFERWLHKYIGGPEYIRRPLDEKGTVIWELCDGKHTVRDICNELDKRFKEEVEPVFPRVQKFLEMLLRLNLIRLIPVSQRRVE
jgi:hypothetical protein